MSRCIIIAAYNPYGIKNSIQLREDDFILCADGGYNFARSENIVPHTVIGDFDSMHAASIEADEVIRVPSEKDDTDTMLCVKHAIEKGYREIVIVGGIGGRFDHTLANLQTLSYACGFGANISLVDWKTRMTLLSHCERVVQRPDGVKYLSLFSLTDACTGVCVTGVKYPLEDAVLTSSFPLGISNEFIEDEIRIGVKTGKLLLVMEQEQEFYQDDFFRW